MYLKKIEIKGFKSFADRTEIDLQRGITAVVGPNGSGKSNIADAIRWVLGEQSAKTLRGNKMDDVIFVGTENRGGLGFAEVTLVIDNMEKLIDIEFSEIQVKRRLYRTGESEYSVNGSQCRLKDIVEMFMDTGIGRDGYSLIGQGKIDEILSTKSEDRRNVFEQAAGIVKYKQRKNESERKLENTKQNLLRVEDIIAELESQLEPLENQAEDARKYLIYRDELREIEINLRAHEYSKLRDKLNIFKLEDEKLLKSKKEYQIKIEENMVDIQGLREKEKNIDLEFTKTNGNILDLEKTYENRQGTLTLLNERHDNFKREKEGLLENIKEEENLIIDVEGSITSLEKFIEDEKVGFSSLEEELSLIKEEFKVVQLKYEENERLIENKKSDSIQVLRDLSEISNRDNSYNINIKNLEDRRNQLEKERDIKLKRVSILEEEILTSKILIEKTEKELLALEKDLEEKKTLVSILEKEKLELNNNRSKVYDDLKRREARMFTLNAMEKDMEGFSRGVKSILKKYSSSEGVIGTVSDIIDVPREFEIAVETSLMSSLQNIITTDEAVARKAIDYLKKNNLGRATFYPLTTIKGRVIELSDDVKLTNGFKGIASEIVNCDLKFKNIINNLLGRVIICDTLLNAGEISKKTNRMFKIVTLDGDVINSGGSYTGGSSNIKNSGLISRKNTIKILEDEVGLLKKELLNIERNIGEKTLRIEDTTEEKDVLSSKCQELILYYNSEKSKGSSLNENIKILTDDINGFMLELEHIKGEVIKNNEFSLSIIEERKALNNKQEDLKKEIEGMTILFRSENLKKDEIQGKITSKSIELAENKKSIESLEEKLKGKIKEIELYKSRIEAFKNKILDIERKILQTQEETKNTVFEALTSFQ